MKTITLACLASLFALPAIADRNPQPKPSGIVIHLFGPNLITTTHSGTGTSSSQQTSPGSNDATPDASDPSMSQVLHQLFVTGDPDQANKPRFPKGRAASSG